MMEFINDFTKLEAYPRSVVKMATQVLSPFAPHIAEEIWQLLGCKESLSYSPFPVADESFLHDDVITYVVQVNGRVRGRFDLPKDQPEAEVMTAAKKHPGILRYLDRKEIQKVIFVPNKLLNIVIKD